MPAALLQTKLYIPPIRLNLVPRPQLIQRLNQGLQSGHKLALVSAPAGFGKTTLLAEWAGDSMADAGKDSQSGQAIAWLSLDENDGELTRFLTCLATALNEAKGIQARIDRDALATLRSSQPAPAGTLRKPPAPDYEPGHLTRSKTPWLTSLKFPRLPDPGNSIGGYTYVVTTMKIDTQQHSFYQEDAGWRTSSGPPFSSSFRLACCLLP